METENCLGNAPFGQNICVSIDQKKPPPHPSGLAISPSNVNTHRYVGASSGEKDVLIIIDKSGSMKEKNRMTLAATAAKSVLGTLGQRSYVNVIMFNNAVAKSCFGDELVRATAANVEQLKNWIDKVAKDPGSGTDFKNAFTAAFDIFDAHYSAHDRFFFFPSISAPYRAVKRPAGATSPWGSSSSAPRPRSTRVFWICSDGLLARGSGASFPGP